MTPIKWHAVLTVAGVGVVILLVAFAWKNFRGAGPAVRPAPPDIAESSNTTGLPLHLPPGFAIEVFARNLPGARVMVRDSFGNFWVSQTSEGTITQLEVDRESGHVRSQNVIFRGLRRPHGLALHPQNKFMLYIAEEHRISRVLLYSEGSLEKIADLPAGDGHFTRTLGFGPDGRLYVSLGSSCNVCDETDPRRAKIFSLNSDGSDLKEFARGLRNAVFFTWHPATKQMWATEMGRDLLGDDLPPDEINIVTADNDYGWPLCFGKNILDTAFHRADHDHIRAHCTLPFEQPSHVDLPAHSAPLGLAFIPSTSWPADYPHDMLVAYHGSWNRSQPTGYKVVRVQLNERGEAAGIEDFITGWLTADNRALGRPVDLRVEDNGTLYISDDKAGVLYKVTSKQ